MDRKLKFSFRIGDFFAICLVVGLAVMVFLGYLIGNQSVEKAKVQIYQDNKLLAEYFLDSEEEIVYVVNGKYENRIVIKGGEVFVEYSNCPGADCVHSGSISKPGRSIACLPNKVEIRITGTSDTDIDMG